MREPAVPQRRVRRAGRDPEGDRGPQHLRHSGRPAVRGGGAAGTAVHRRPRHGRDRDRDGRHRGGPRRRTDRPDVRPAGATSAVPPGDRRRHVPRPAGPGRGGRSSGDRRPGRLRPPPTRRPPSAPSPQVDAAPTWRSRPSGCPRSGSRPSSACVRAEPPCCSAGPKAAPHSTWTRRDALPGIQAGGGLPPRPRYVPTAVHLLSTGKFDGMTLSPRSVRWRRWWNRSRTWPRRRQQVHPAALNGGGRSMLLSNEREQHRPGLPDAATRAAGRRHRRQRLGAGR